MMPRPVGTSAKADRDQLRERMLAQGASMAQLATELGRRFNLRPRLAWRYALGWPQWKLAQRYNSVHPGARLADNRVSEHESWPHGGRPPSPRYLAELAATLGHGCTPAQLVDADDLERLSPADRTLLTAPPPPPDPLAATPIPSGAPAPTPPTSARQDYALGPRAVLGTVLAQRDLTRALAHECPPELRLRLLSASSEASRQAGWLSYDLNRFDHAGYYYEDARTLAHDAQNVELSAFVLCQMSQLATWQAKPRIGIDHAVAAEQWAQHTGNPRLRAFAADVAARAYAADRQRDLCLAALDTAHTVLTSASDHTPSQVPLYDEGLHLAIRGGYHLTLRDGQRAAECAQQSLGALDQSCARNVAMTLVDLGEARAQGQEIEEAARLLGHTAAVRQLDDRLAPDSME